MTIPITERLFSKYIEEPNTGCFLWIGSITDSGYGEINARKTHGTNLAHRIMYEIVRGPIPKGLDIDHLCRVRNCVNPDHMEPVTNQENTRRGNSTSAHNARKTHCKRGHAFDLSNTILIPSSTPSLVTGRSARRRCYQCTLVNRRHAQRRRRLLQREQRLGVETGKV